MAEPTRRTVVHGDLRDLHDSDIPRPVGPIVLGGFMPGVAKEIAIALKSGLAIYALAP
jgi:hypothetical protein